VLEEFPLGRVMDALDMIEFEGLDQQAAVSRVLTDQKKPIVPDSAASWVRSAIGWYLAAERSGGGGEAPVLLPVEGSWVVQAQVSQPLPYSYEVCAWGRRYESADGATRELRTLAASWRAREPDQAEVAVAAYVTGRGNRVHAAYSTRPYPIGTAAEVARVRVTQVNCVTGGVRVLFDGSPAEAYEVYVRLARGPLRRAVDGGAYVPGSDCAKCKMISVCPALPRRPGLLAVPAGAVGGQGPRVWSATTGRDFRGCPAREYLRRVRVPRDPALEYSDAAVRGQAVHALLRLRHQREPRRACSASDLPDEAGQWSAGRWTVTGEQAAVGRAVLAWHTAVCPLRALPADAELHGEREVVALDTFANTLVIATPDLLYRDGPAWVWREVKTTQRDDFVDGLQLLRRYPQLAVAVGLLWTGVLPGDRDEARIEVEQLSPHAGTVDVLVPADAGVRAVAREVVGALASGWYAETMAPARPGAKCRTCEVSSWCPSAAVPPAEGGADPAAD
jgi:hypothetical protein